jgi:hypothetical protein
MSGEIIRNLIYIMRSHEATCNPPVMEEFLQTFMDLGYWLAAGMEQETYLMWDRRLYAAPDADLPSLEPGISDPLREQMQLYLAGQHDSVGVFAYSTGPVAFELPAFHFVCAFEEQEEGAICLFTTGNGSAWGAAADVVWDDIARRMYRLWRPLYAYSYFDLPGEVRLEREDVLTLHLPYLHRRMNFLGPELVDALGRERVLTTPGAKIGALDDGGAYLYLWPHDNAQATKHLGLSVEGV